MKTIFKNGLGIRGVLGAALMIMALATTGCGKEDIQVDQLLGTWVTDEDNSLKIKQATFTEDVCYLYIEPIDFFGEKDMVRLSYSISDDTLTVLLMDYYGAPGVKIKIVKLNDTKMKIKGVLSYLPHRPVETLEFTRKE